MYTILPQLKPEVTGLALQEVRAPCNQTRRNPRVCPVIALLIDPQFIALSAGIAVLSSTLASLIPARRSARLDPMEVIRNG